MTTDEIRQTVADYARAACNAMVAGFDGVQILANYLYLLAQFLNRTTNRRTDEYGGGLEGSARMLVEVVAVVLQADASPRVGVTLTPEHEEAAFASPQETPPKS